jgi:hypothetical protein
MPADLRGCNYRHAQPTITIHRSAGQNHDLHHDLHHDTVDLFVSNLLRKGLALVGSYTPGHAAGTMRLLTCADAVIGTRNDDLSSGAPYERAKERGVKLVRATAHYATRDLDVGPIIDRDVVWVSRRYIAAGLTWLGADIERTVLAGAVVWHCED